MTTVDLQDVQALIPRKADLESLLGDLHRVEHYEIHVTVKCDGEVEAFKETCASLKVKPLVVQLAEGAVHDDVMTSSSIHCTPLDLRLECIRIVVGLKAVGWNVVRCKIECSPFHAKVVNLVKEDILPFQYFESHIPVIMGPEQTDDDWRRLRVLAEMYTCHMSANAFKVQDDTRTIMLTFRSTLFDANTFALVVTKTCNFLATCFFKAEKPVVEFAIFDSNRAHDADWLKASRRVFATVSRDI